MPPTEPYPRENTREYRKTATVMAGQAPAKGIIPTLEGDHTYEAGDYICGPGQAGEYWPVKRSIFEATYVPATLPPTDPTAALRTAVIRAFHEAAGSPPHWADNPYCERLADDVIRALASQADDPSEPKAAAYNGSWTTATYPYPADDLSGPTRDALYRRIHAIPSLVHHGKGEQCYPITDAVLAALASQADDPSGPDARPHR